MELGCRQWYLAERREKHVLLFLQRSRNVHPGRHYHILLMQNTRHIRTLLPFLRIRKKNSKLIEWKVRNMAKRRFCCVKAVKEGKRDCIRERSQFSSRFYADYRWKALRRMLYQSTSIWHKVHLNRTKMKKKKNENKVGPSIRYIQAAKGLNGDKPSRINKSVPARTLHFVWYM